ncbi:hypothetical protein BGW38_008840 [Lunasporangiospora selenospora]|uniref:Uncharacterized protein n=1 Tax=Lunasporangiospora selenospora TaxID=979761 RepID=A0A9P6KG52_9FUNG|nr:hypothetical protein BGW38_008840 [Lunasporangiospora selenospora]
MKFSLLQCLALLACIVALVSAASPADDNNNTVSNSHNKKKVKPNPKAKKPKAMVCPPGSEIFCKHQPDDIGRMFENAFVNQLIQRENAARRGGSTADRRRQPRPSNGIMKQLDIFSDIKSYFVNYWHNIQMIFQGRFGEGIFNQLKNSGSWCEKDNWIVKAVKAVINKLSGGALTVICDCFYPMIKGYDTYQDLFSAVENKGLGEVMGKCSNNMRQQIQEALQKIFNP